MFAMTFRKETAFRVLLSAAILFSASGPITVSAEPLDFQDAGETATATPSQTPTETQTATETFTATNSATVAPASSTTVPPLSSGDDVSATPTATETPVESTGTPFPIETVTPVPPTQTSLPATAITETTTAIESQISLKLEISPETILPNGIALLHWTIEGLSLDPQMSFILQFKFPEGILLPDVKKNWTYDSANHTLSIPVEELDGTVQIQAQDLMDEVTVKIELLEQGESIATAGVFIPVQEQFILERSGGAVQAMNGRVRVVFPQDALPEKALIKIGSPTRSTAPPYSLLSHPFEINAQVEKSKEDLQQFSKEISIFVSYEELNIPEALEGSLYLYWYNPKTEEWEALPTTVNRETKTIHALTDHFTVFDMNINNWQSSHLPTIDSFQVSGFTGAATYSLPIEAPPGPGGFQPNISLSYNSQIVDQSTLNTQASWVGMGWSLEAGSIEIDTHGTPDWFPDDTHLLNVGGVSTRIVKDANGIYRAADENFWDITFNLSNNTWTVRDKQGTTYFFEYVLTYQRQTGECPSPDTGHETVSYRWMLTRVRNIFDQEIVYTYQKQQKTIRLQEYWTGTGQCRTVDATADTAHYLSTITYANGRYRIRFDKGTTPNRFDYQASWDSDYVFHTYEKYRLQNIYIEQDADGNASFETQIHRYQLTYASDTDSDIIFPGFAWSAYGKTSTLRSIQEYGSDDHTSLPAITFTYGDNLHLTRADNGYGGAVEFEYDPVPWSYQAYARQSLTDLNKLNKGCKFGDPAPWRGRPGSEVACEDNSGAANDMIVRGTAYISNTTYSEFDRMWVRPGGMYKLSAYLTELDPNVTYRLGLGDGTTDQFSNNNQSIAIFHLPATADKVERLIQTGGGTGYAHLSSFKFELLTSIYRVTQKRLYDGRENVYNFSFSYLGAAVNDATHSAGVCGFTVDSFGEMTNEDGCHEYFEKFSEFRGHSQVTETGPDGRMTITQFNQDDILKGRPNSIAIRSGSTQLTRTDYTYSINPMSIAGYSACNVCTLFLGLERTWVYTSEEENLLFDGSSYTSTKASYTYEPTYGNLTGKEEYGNGALYRYTEYTYTSPNTAEYLVSLIAKTKTFDATNNVLGIIIYLYDNNTGSYNVVPPAGILTTIRTLAKSGSLYSQVDYGYDAWGNQTSQKTYDQYAAWDANPPGGGRTSYTCFGGGGTLGGTACMDDGYHTYPLWSKNPLGHKTTLVYDYTLGVPLTETDPNGNVTSAGYDFLGRMTSLTRPEDGTPSLTMEYSPNPFKVTLTQRLDSSNSYILERHYDGMGRMIQTKSRLSRDGLYTNYTITDYTYNAYGQVLTQSVPYTTAPIAYSQNIYDSFGRLLTVKAPGGYITAEYSYNGPMTTIKTRDTAGILQPTVTLADEWGRTVSITPPTGPGISYTYDKLDRLKTAVRGGFTTTLSYDFAGRKISMSDPDMGYWTYDYDALGNLTTQTDARGCRLTLLYDLSSRLKNKDSSGASGCGTPIHTSYTYDQGANGNSFRTRMDDTSGYTTWTYDARGRVTSETKNISGQTFTTQWEYNLADMPVTIIYPDGEEVTQTYNAQLLANTLFSAQQTYVSSTSYDAAGRLTQRVLGNGVAATNYTYYPWESSGRSGRLQSLTSSRLSNGFVFQRLDYGYDPAGNITSITNIPANETQTYEYDLLNRLKKWTLGGATEIYTYNGTTGNLETKGSLTLQYNDAAHKHAVTSAGGNTYTYDANGNMNYRNANGATSSFTYDAEGRLVSADGVTNPSPTPLASPTPMVASPTATLPPTATKTITPTPTKTKTPTPTVTPAPIFADVPYGHPYKEYIEALYNQGITGGCASNPLRYCPSDTVSRAQIAIFLLKAKHGAGYTPPAVGSSTGFNDVPVTHWAAAWIKQFAAEGFTSGCGGGNYCPDTPLTREGFAVFALRAKNVNSVPTYSTYSYNDIASSYARNWIQHLASGYGIHDYCTTGKYCPTGNLTRDRLAFILVRLFNYPLAYVPSPVLAETLPQGKMGRGEGEQGDFLVSSPLPSNHAPKMAAMTALETINATFTYDGDGKRVKQTVNGVTTYFIGNYYEVTGSTVTKYYYSGGQRVAMRTGGTLYFMFSDHLGSTSITTDSAGNVVSELRYSAWGEVRYASGVTPTRYQFTGQFSYESQFGLYYFNARWLDPYLNHFTQPDSIVPDPNNSQAWDRYAYVSNNPLRYTDPTGHKECDYKCQIKYEGADPDYEHYGEGLSCWGPTECLGIKPNTVAYNAIRNNDGGAWLDLLFPTSFALRFQGEIVSNTSLLNGIIPTSGSYGVNLTYNRVDDNLALSTDFTPEVGPVLSGAPFGVSATGGPVITWASSDIDQTATGQSYVVGGTLAAEEAISAAVITPADQRADSVYGIKPLSIFVGYGKGGGYATGGGGISFTLTNYTINLSQIFGPR